MSNFNFDAPQYIDFTSPNSLNGHHNIERYFDLDHENYIEPEQSCVEESPKRPKLRRSASAGALNLQIEEQKQDYISAALENVHLDDEGAQPQLPTEVLVVPAPGRGTRPKVLLKPRSVSRDALHRLGLPYAEPQKRKTSVENLQQNKYISFAEAVRKFQTATPQRFRRTTTGNPVGGSAPMGHTVPQSPMLSTKMRARPVVDYISKEQQLELEAEEMKKYKIKARPVNYKILQGALPVPKVDKKATTEPQPFHLTEVKHQKEKPEEPQYEFHARPAPISTARPQPITKPSPKPITKPKTPSCISKYKKQYVYAVSENTDPNAEPTAKNVVHLKEVALAYDGIPKQLFSKPVTRTVLEPFSFEERDKRLQRKKEEKIRKLLENEKKIREFHARPIPKTISSSGKVESKIGKLISEGSSLSIASLKNDENATPNTTEAGKSFKARPASVIHQKPFIPKKDDRPLLEIEEFQLSTRRRAVERWEFDKKLQEKDEETKQLRKEYEENLKIQEELEVAKLRKALVHKANPIKQYKPLEILPSTKKVTSPVSPHITKQNKKDS